MWPSPAHCSRNANIGVLCRRGNGRTAGCVGNNSRSRVAGRYSPAGDSNRSRAVSLYLREISISCPPTLTREGWYSPTLLAGGFKVFFISVMYGMLIYGASLVIRMLQKPKI